MPQCDSLAVPDLRERREDIPCWRIIPQEICRAANRSILRMNKASLDALCGTMRAKSAS